MKQCLRAEKKIFFTLFTNILLLMGNVSPAGYLSLSLNQLLLVGLENSQGLRIKTNDSHLGGESSHPPDARASCTRPLDLCLHLQGVSVRTPLVASKEKTTQMAYKTKGDVLGSFTEKAGMVLASGAGGSSELKFVCSLSSTSTALQPWAPRGSPATQRSQLHHAGSNRI